MPPNPLANAWLCHALHGALLHANTPTFPENFLTPPRNEILDTPLYGVMAFYRVIKRGMVLLP